MSSGSSGNHAGNPGGNHAGNPDENPDGNPDGNPDEILMEIMAIFLNGIHCFMRVLTNRTLRCHPYRGGITHRSHPS